MFARTKKNITVNYFEIDDKNGVLNSLKTNL